MTDAATRKAELDEDRAAYDLKCTEPKIHNQIIERIVELGETPEQVAEWIDRWYRWETITNIRTKSFAAARSIYRRNEGLKAAREALDKAGDKAKEESEQS